MLRVFKSFSQLHTFSEARAGRVPSGIWTALLKKQNIEELSSTFFYGEFDSGSERTLAAWIRHASRAIRQRQQCGCRGAAQGCVTRG